MSNPVKLNCVKPVLLWKERFPAWVKPVLAEAMPARLCSSKCPGEKSAKSKWTVVIALLTVMVRVSDEPGCEVSIRFWPLKDGFGATVPMLKAAGFGLDVKLAKKPGGPTSGEQFGKGVVCRKVKDSKVYIAVVAGAEAPDTSSESTKMGRVQVRLFIRLFLQVEL